MRAGLVRRPWDYVWSSAGAHCGVWGDGSGLLDLRAWSEEMPAEEWKATLVSIGDSHETIESLRMHTRTGRPLGSDTFLSKVETFVRRRVRSVAMGRPVGSKDGTKRQPRMERNKAMTHG